MDEDHKCYGHVDHISFGRREKCLYNYRSHYTQYRTMVHIIKHLLKTSVGKPYNEVRSHFIKKYCNPKKLGWSYKECFDGNFGNPDIEHCDYYINSEGIICSNNSL